jgi:tetratricopeptide (TPR) repeat protein
LALDEFLPNILYLSIPYLRVQVSNEDIFMREVFLTLSLLLVLATPALGGNTTPTSGKCLSCCQDWTKVYEGKSADIHKAIDDINKAMVKPDVDCCTLSGLVYMGKGRYDRVIANIHKAIDDVNKAIDDVNKAMERTDADFYTLRGLVYIDKGLDDKAIENINKAFADINKAMEKTDAHFCTLRGLVYRGRGRYDKAIENINKDFADINKAINLNL